MEMRDATRFAYATETDEPVYSTARTTDWKQTSKSGVGAGGHQQSNGVTTFGTSNLAVQRTDWHAVVFEQLFLLSVFSAARRPFSEINTKTVINSDARGHICTSSCLVLSSIIAPLFRRTDN